MGGCRSKLVNMKTGMLVPLLFFLTPVRIFLLFRTGYRWSPMDGGLWGCAGCVFRPLILGVGLPGTGRPMQC